MRRRIVLVLLSIAVLAIGVLIVSPRPTQAATFTVTNLNNGGPGSLRGQLALAADGDTIVFDTNLPDNSVILLTSPIGLGHSVTINGAAVAGLKISGGGSVRVFGVNLSVTPTLRNLSVINGADTAGGCINANTINMVNVTISGCTSTLRGGGVFLWGSTSTLTNVTFSNNHAGTDGGALMVANGATVTITNGTFSSNTAGADGGALAVDNGSVLTVNNGGFSSNTATVGGGAIRNESIGAGGLPGLSVQNSSIHDNNAQGGGGISNGLGGILRISNTVIHANGAQWGGGISNDGTNTTLTIINSTISSNTATGNLGGGLSNYADASFTISGSFFDGNSTNT